MIYVINDYKNISHYVCVNQEMVDKGQEYEYDGVYSIGNEEDAKVILNEKRQEWLSKNLNLFSVNIDIDVTEGTEWRACDLNKEPENNEQRYQVLDLISGHYSECVGLNSAKQLLNESQQKAMNHCIFLHSFNEFVKREKKQN